MKGNNSISPGPALPVTAGRLMDFIEDPIVCMRALQARHGNVAALQEGDQRMIFVFGQEWNQRILSDTQTFHSKFFAVRGPRNSAQRRVSSGLLSMNGDEHKQQRRLVMGPFQKKTLATYHDAICRLTHELLESWKPGDVRDLHADMTRFMLRVTSAMLFGCDRPELAYRIGATTERWVDLNHQTGMATLLADSIFHDKYRQLLQVAQELENDLQQLLDYRRQAAGPGGDVLSLLLRAYQEEGRVHDQELIGHVALLFAAAFGTTAHSLTWTLFLLAQHPETMKSVYDEIARGVAGEAPTPEEAARLPALERAIKESMRVLPASAHLQRTTTRALDFGPFFLAPSTPIIFSQFMTHHMPELFSDPDSYVPDRWLTIAPSPYAYLPFGAGPRMCLGAPLAMMTMKTALPMILKRFRIHVVSGSEISAKVISTMLGPITSVPVEIHLPDGNYENSPVTGNIHTLVHLPAETRPVWKYLAA